MQRLRDHDQVNRGGLNVSTFRGCDVILNALVSLSARNLLRARVRRDDTVENCGQPDRCLTISRGTIPRESATWCNAAEVFK